MGERAKITAKTPETKRGDLISNTRKTNLTKPLSSPIDQILHFYRTIGNQAVQRLFKGQGSGLGIQAKLKIGEPNDIYEQEADRVAVTFHIILIPKFHNQLIVSKQDDRKEMNTSGHIHFKQSLWKLYEHVQQR